MKRLWAGIIALGFAVLVPAAVQAHVVVTPSTASVGDRVSFSIGVPNERDDDTVSVKLAIPKGVTDVMPNVAGGWQISTEKSGDDVTSITWTGTIPAGQRADLAFKAQVPGSAGEVDWKAYQTYADGTVVSWDQKPVADDDEGSNSGPYSVTIVKDDLKTDTIAPSTDSNHATLAIVISVVAFVFSAIALVIRRRKV